MKRLGKLTSNQWAALIYSVINCIAGFLAHMVNDVIRTLHETISL